MLLKNLIGAELGKLRWVVEGQVLNVLCKVLYINRRQMCACVWIVEGVASRDATLK